MTAHSVTLMALQGREPIARDTVAFTFARPAGFTFKPGQAIDVTLIDPPQTDAKGSRRALSIVSAPCEDRLVVATRMRDSAFKRVLGSMPIGGRVQVEGPFGSLTLHGNRSRPAVLIAGGIGITPFMSMLRQAAHDDLPQVIKLIYSNRRPEDAAFLAELQQLEQARRGSFQLVATMTDSAGHIGPDLVRSIIARPATHVFYVAGPPAMVTDMQQLLNRLGIQDDNVRSETFSGY
jgi:ferredoxin-NADP reductase